MTIAIIYVGVPTKEGSLTTSYTFYNFPQQYSYTYVCISLLTA